MLCLQCSHDDIMRFNTRFLLRVDESGMSCSETPLKFDDDIDIHQCVNVKKKKFDVIKMIVQ